MLLTYQNFNYIESPGLDLALAFQNYRPGQKPSQANLAGLAWPGLFWLGLAWLTASGQSRNITNFYRFRLGFQLVPLPLDTLPVPRPAWVFKPLTIPNHLLCFGKYKGNKQGQR